MMTLSTPDLTELLSDWREGDQRALAKLTPLVYDELRRRLIDVSRMTSPIASGYHQ